MNGHEVVNAVLLSGGVDSAYLLEVVKGPIVCVFVDYGQPAAIPERRAASTLAKRPQVKSFEVVKVSGMPLGQMAEGVGAHIVPARNLWLISLAAAFGDSVWIGCGPQDERDYEDCRLHFLADMNQAMAKVSRNLRWSNAPRRERVKTLKQKGIRDYCWSCYGPGPEPCGECASCRQ